MARYTGPRCKLSRRAGTDLGLTGIRSADSKSKLDTPPGQHGNRRGRLSDYAIMLREKQKLRRIYGIMERQFRGLFKKAAKLKGSTGENLMRLLESRLDNVVYRMGFAITRAEARQLVNHSSVMVNGKVVNIPSYVVKPEDVVEIRERSKKQLRIRAAMDSASQIGLPDWVNVDPKKLEGVFKYHPERSEIQLDVNEFLVVEYYSR